MFFVGWALPTLLPTLPMRMYVEQSGRSSKGEYSLDCLFTVVNVLRENTNMSSTTGTEIGELKDLILGLGRNLDKKIDDLDCKIDHLDHKMEVGFTQVQGELKRLDERINSVEKQIEIQIEDVKERLNDTNKMIESNNNRLNAITIGSFGIVGVLVTGLLTVVGKLVFFPSNPIT